MEGKGTEERVYHERVPFWAGHALMSIIATTYRYWNCKIR